MTHLTKTQKATLIALIAYALWEILVYRWKKGLPPSDPVIRVDLIIIYPIILVLLAISVYQFIKKKQ